MIFSFWLGYEHTTRYNMNTKEPKKKMDNLGALIDDPPTASAALAALGPESEQSRAVVRLAEQAINSTSAR
jgi:hypothetical protein